MSGGAGKAFLKCLCDISAGKRLQRSLVLLPASALQIAGPAVMLPARAPAEMCTPTCAIPPVVMLALLAAASVVVCACCVAKYVTCRLHS